MNLLERRRGMMAKEGDSVLPSGYQELEYLENPLGSDAYIVSGIMANDTIGFEVDAALYDPFNTYQFGTLFGSRYANYNRDFGLLSFSNATKQGELRCGNTTYSYSAGIYQNQRFFASLIDDVYRCGSVEVSVGRFMSFGISICIFRQGTFNSTATYIQGHGRIYSLKFYKDGALVRDFVPCINPLNEYGLFDLVEQTFYGNAATSGAFTGA